MMKKLIIELSLALIMIGQTTIAQNRCDISHLFNLTNQSDTIVVKGTIQSIKMRFGVDSSLVYMQKKNILKIKNFNSSIEFKIEGCRNYHDFYFEVKCESQKKIEYLNNFKPSQLFNFTCIIFNDKNIPKGYIKDEPFIIITNIRKAD
jgi:hypothetical protein